jgi:hypothetical protein
MIDPACRVGRVDSFKHIVGAADKRAAGAIFLGKAGSHGVSDRGRNKRSRAGRA